MGLSDIRFYSFNLEFQPISFLQMVNAAVKCQQEFECMFIRHILS